MLLQVGCRETSLPSTTLPTAIRTEESTSAQQDDFAVAYELLTRSGSGGEVDRLALYHFNQYLARADRSESRWSVPTLAQRVPKSLASIQPLQELDRMRLTRDDLEYLRSRICQRELWKTLKSRPLEPLMQQQVDEVTRSNNDLDQKQIATLLQAFDWTIRNIQLDRLVSVEESSDASAMPADESGATPPQRGLAGPGYMHYPYETMLAGHGDAYERSRVFIELCRQGGLPAFMVAIRPKTAPLKPWVVGVLLNDDVYLFDAEVGLPLPGQGGRGIATLAEVVADPELLRQMNISEGQPYRAQPADMESLEILLAVAPTEMSKRMLLLSERFEDSAHLNVYVDVNQLAQRLKTIPALKSSIVALWRVPFECYLYALGRGLRMNRDKAFAIENQRDMYLLNIPSPLQFARRLQFQGDLDATTEKQGATALLLSARQPQRAIDELMYSSDLQRAAGIAETLSPDPVARRDQLETYASFYQRLRDNVTYWLGLIQYEKRDYETALDWLQERTLESTHENPWQQGSRYNVGRCYEALGKYGEAIKFYRDGNSSPQYEGNLLRAKLLEERVEK